MTETNTPQDRNKAVVVRFNKRVIEALDRAAFDAIMHPDFVNRTAPPGMSAAAEGLWTTFAEMLHPAFPDLAVEIEDQVAEADKVVTRKTIRGTHNGPLTGIAPTGRRIAISVIDIVRLEDGRYKEHWGINTLPALLAQLRQPSS